MMERPRTRRIILWLLVAVSICTGSALTAGTLRSDRDAAPSEPPVELSPEETAYFLQRQTDGNAVGLVMTNYGFFGNNLVTRAPSMEYPLGSQIEHMVRAGLWVGGINANGDTVVSSGSVSGQWGSGSATLSEYTPTTKIVERSTLLSSRAYNKKAKSEQDFISSYRDYGPIRPGNRGKALNISITQRSYLWSFEFAEAFVIVSFTVKNESELIIRDLCLGVFSELASGWKGAYDTWRPSGSSWFKKKKLEYFPTQRMISEHHWNYQAGTAPSWGAIAILGTKGTGVPPISSVPVSFNWWDWYHERDFPQEYTDVGRFKLMSNGEMDDPSTIVVPDGPEDPVELVSAGPFPEMVPGDSIVFACAFLGGMDRASLVENCRWAQLAFDNSYILPSPPQLGRFKITPESGALNVYWQNSYEDSVDPFFKIPDFEGYRVYVTRKEGATSKDFELVRDVDLIDDLGYDTGFGSISETNQIDTLTYNYHCKISNLKDGFKYWVALTTYDKGVPEQGVESMQSGVLATKVMAIPGPSDQVDATVQVFPNPYKGQAVWDGARDREKYIWFVNLPLRATIRIYTLAGDHVKTLEFDAATYTGAEIQGLKTSSERSLAMPGGMCAWDMISQRDQAVATGLYLFSVEDKDTGKSQVGKFMIIR